MLRHAKGYQLASKGVDTRAIQGYLGHKNIQHTVLYTKLDAKRFKGFGPRSRVSDPALKPKELIIRDIRTN